MRVLAFVGPSGTGKSYRAQLVARENNIHYIIDDGLLINENEVLAGTSAKKAPTKIETVKHALFIEEKEQADMKKAFKKYKPDSLLILGTSDKMIQKIIESLDLPPLEKTIYINEVATEEEMEKKDIYSVIKKGYYDIIFDNDVVTDAKLSTKGELSKFKDDFFNLMIKSIHFADIKDYFITLSNNGTAGVSLVPSYFTSQMDSIDHKIYFVQDNKSGKLKLANKHKVRSSQEKHINGLNADYNAARNIAYIMENNECRNMFMKQSRTDKSLYNKPSYETFIKTQGSAVAKLKKEGFVKILDEASA